MLHGAGDALHRRGSALHVVKRRWQHLRAVNVSTCTHEDPETSASMQKIPFTPLLYPHQGWEVATYSSRSKVADRRKHRLMQVSSSSKYTRICCPLPILVESMGVPWASTRGSGTRKPSIAGLCGSGGGRGSGGRPIGNICAQHSTVRTIVIVYTCDDMESETSIPERGKP
jgi:hypothetical protein